MVTAFSEHVLDTLRTGLHTDAHLDGTDPPSLRVTWIDWDSGFRGSGLRVADRIVAMNGSPIRRPADLPQLQQAIRELPGGLNEGDVMAATGLADGGELCFTVRRRAYPGDGWTTVDVVGQVRTERVWSAENARRGLGPTGPDALVNDGFDSPWSSWYEQRVFAWSQVLDEGWSRSRRSNRPLLADELAEQPRIDLLVQNYPGPFAEAAAADWQAVVTSLSGIPYELTSDALDFRELGEQRTAQITAAGQVAWQRYLADHAAETVPAFPSVDPFRGDRSGLVGNLVVLPEITPRQWLISMGSVFLSATDRTSWYFVPLEDPAVRAVYEAANRYRRCVAPDLRESILIAGRVLPDPRMLAADGSSAAGFDVAPAAALMGGSLFVDLEEPEHRFAGERDLKDLQVAELGPAATPRQVIEGLVSALKLGDEDAWKALFADWYLVPGEGPPLYYAFYPYPPANVDEDWIRSRALILGDLEDVRVVWTGEPRLLLRGTDHPGAPDVEEVAVEVDHIGSFDGEHRAFCDTRVHRVWSVQRRNAGPWRVASFQGI